MTPWPIVITAALAGAVVGSYVTTAALRATDETAPAGARSQCDGCRRQLTWWESAPLVSYPALGGRCRTCASPIAPYHPIGEGVGLLAGVAIAWATPDLRALALVLMAVVLLGAAVIDARVRLLPNLMTVAVAVIATVLAAAHGWNTLLEGFAAAALCLAMLGGVAFAYRRRRGEIGIGGGDVKLFTALAIWLGAATAWMVLAAAALGLLIALLARPGDRRVPLGPMIAASGFCIGLLLEVGLWPRL